MRPDVPFLVAGDPQQRSGGYGYDRRMVDELAALGQRVRLEGLPGQFPDTDELARRSLDSALRARPDDGVVLLDGLVLGGAADVVASHGERLRLVAIIHHPLADETGLDPAVAARLDQGERRALRSVCVVVATSDHTARRLRAMGVAGAQVVRPGTDPAAPTPHQRQTRPWQLLCVASVIPRKDYYTLINALAELGERDWYCRCIGSLAADPEYAREVQAHLQDRGLGDRVAFVGELDDAGMAAAYHQADVFVLPTRYEGYGMAFTEALARGIPVIAGDGGAVRQTVPSHAARLIQPGDAVGLARALARFMDEPGEREQLREGALAARESLPDWTDQAKQLLGVVESVRRG